VRAQIVLYTALLGDYDDLKEHGHPPELSFCFTDRPCLMTKSWTLVPCEQRPLSVDDRIRTARFYKTQPHRVLPPHRISLWTDASMRINEPLELVVNFLRGRSIATFKYPDIYGSRTCAFDEALACLRRGKDASDIIQGQMQRYREEGLPINFGLAETTMMVRENTTALARLNDTWWGEICRGSRRDQLSFDYCCWRHGLEYAWLPGYRLKNPFATYVRHKTQVYPGHSYSSEDHRTVGESA